MKYVQPYGVSDANASYVNGDPSIAQKGSIPPAAVFENPQREIVAIITANNLTPADADVQQLLKAIRSGYMNYADDTGSINFLSVAFTPPLSAYTRGLPIKVRARTTNTAGVTIDAGAGRVPVRKMNGADLAAGEWPAGGVALLCFDGTVFQVINFGGGGGGTGDVFEVKIPYCVDTSTTPGQVLANFSPAITTLAAGDMVAVKIAQTAPGPTKIYVNAMSPIDLKPNGGGPMLQGDMHTGNIVLFFFDGTNFYFPPDPVIDAAVQYTVGPGQQFPDVPTALNTIKRKSIGANGFITLKLTTGVFPPINASHADGTRVCIRGTMIGATPIWSDFAATGNSAAQRAQDATYNINMLRGRYGTEIKLVSGTVWGVQNSGPGQFEFQDLLITGHQLPPPSAPLGAASEYGVYLPQGNEMICINVAVWGCQTNYENLGAMTLSGCWGTGSTYIDNVSAGGAQMWAYSCGAFGAANDGFYVNGASGNYVSCVALMNGRAGLLSSEGSSLGARFANVLGNAVADCYALDASSLSMVNCSFGTTSPAVGVVGNSGSVVTNINI